MRDRAIPGERDAVLPAHEVGRRSREQRRRSRPGLPHATALLVRRWDARPAASQKAGAAEKAGLGCRIGGSQRRRDACYHNRSRGLLWRRPSRLPGGWVGVTTASDSIIATYCSPPLLDLRSSSSLRCREAPRRYGFKTATRRFSHRPPRGLPGSTLCSPHPTPAKSRNPARPAGGAFSSSVAATSPPATAPTPTGVQRSTRCTPES